jgi:CRISPR-associated exonuclease Cas4
VWAIPVLLKNFFKRRLTVLYEIPISLFRQYTFCPRIVHFQLIRNYQPVYPYWVEAGQEEHIAREKRIQKKLPRLLQRLNGNVRFNVHVSSQRGFYGIVDAVIETSSEQIPLEFKASFQSLNRGTLRQLTGYALALEEKTSKPSPFAYILFGRRTKLTHVRIGPKERDDFERTLESIRNLLEDCTLPDSGAPPAKCAQCEYLKFCNDRREV